MQVHLFGATTPTGEALRQRLALAQPDWDLHAYSRRTHAADFCNPDAFRPAGDSVAASIWISFAPIWLLAPFFQQLASSHPKRLQGLRGVIACSSSSVLTKRFAANRFDRQLVAQLNEAEAQLINSCRHLQIPCLILQPTLIYGQVGPYSDQNLSRLLVVLRRMPLLPLPAHTGLRQPIHAGQLAAVALRLAEQFAAGVLDASHPERITLGGDQLLSYRAMLQALQLAQPPGDRARRCRLLPIPNRLFFLLSAPLLLHSPKVYEAVLRMAADLAGFTPAHQLLEQLPAPFPVPDLR